MSDDLLERLGIIARAEMSNYAERTVNEAAAALIEARAEIARLREALEGMINALDDWPYTVIEDKDAHESAVRAARAALAPRDAKQGDS